MFRKFEKTLRIRVPQYDTAGKFCLSHDDAKALLTGTVTIEEKLDGANVGIIRNKSDLGFALQKRGSLVGPSEHAQFNYFVNWAHKNRERILRMRIGDIAYCELLYAKHNIHYTRLPSYVILFDVWDAKTKQYIGLTDIQRFSELVEIPLVPVLYSGQGPEISALIKLIGQSAYYDGLMEGIVVKNYRKQMRGKIVRPEFMKEIDESEHWTNASIVKNSMGGQAFVRE
jgi:ATP-dependent RNA circularization protein (DNA/RNA ligase family)